MRQPMVRSSQKSDATKPQRDRFIETARQLGCDEDEKAFDEQLKKIAKQQPKPPPDNESA